MLILCLTNYIITLQNMFFYCHAYRVTLDDIRYQLSLTNLESVKITTIVQGHKCLHVFLSRFYLHVRHRVTYLNGLCVTHLNCLCVRLTGPATSIDGTQMCRGSYLKTSRWYSIEIQYGLIVLRCCVFNDLQRFKLENLCRKSPFNMSS